MNKVLVTIYVFSLDEEFDMFLPIGIKMADALQLIQESIRELTNDNYSVGQSSMLYNDEGYLINLNNIVKLSGIKNGCKLLLI